MKHYSYLIIDDNQESFLHTKTVVDGFADLSFVGAADNYKDGVNQILEHKPDLVFLEIDPINKNSNLSLALINELYRYLDVVPKIIITTSKSNLAFEAIQYEVLDYLIKPIAQIDIIKLELKLNKGKIVQPLKTNDVNILDVISESSNKGDVRNKEKPLILCIKSYGDYRYINAKDICYLQADNNSTDIHLSNGEMVTAFKTLKHFEGILSFPFIRIHNSYIVNRNCISRIHTGNTVCYIKNSAIKLPFSKSYKTNIDLIISEFSSGNYLEI